MKKPFKFGTWSMQQDYLEVKRAIQCPHLNKKIKRSTVLSASSWASAKWGRNMDYTMILRKLEVEIIED